MIKVAAKYEAFLTSAVASDDTSLSVDDLSTEGGGYLEDGVDYGLVIAEGTDNEEYVIGTLDEGTNSFTNLLRGISPVDGETETGNAYSHRKGDSVKITDHPALRQIINILNGESTTNYFISGAIASDTLRQSADTLDTITSGTTSYTKQKEIKVPFTGTYRITFDLYSGHGTNNAYGQLYRNGTAVGTERITNDTQAHNYSEDILLFAGDTIEVWSKTQVSYNAYVDNFRIYYDIGKLNVGDYLPRVISD